jgi:hypothetical protein
MGRQKHRRQSQDHNLVISSISTRPNTCYVTANPFSDDYVDPVRFGDVDEVWQYAWDDDFGDRSRPQCDGQDD